MIGTLDSPEGPLEPLLYPTRKAFTISTTAKNLQSLAPPISTSLAKGTCPGNCNGGLTARDWRSVVLCWSRSPERWQRQRTHPEGKLTKPQAQGTACAPAESANVTLAGLARLCPFWLRSPGSLLYIRSLDFSGSSGSLCADSVCAFMCLSRGFPHCRAGAGFLIIFQAPDLQATASL